MVAREKAAAAIASAAIQVAKMTRARLRDRQSRLGGQQLLGLRAYSAKEAPLPVATTAVWSQRPKPKYERPTSRKLTESRSKAGHASKERGARFLIQAPSA